MEGIKVYIRVRPLTVDGEASFYHDDEHNVATSISKSFNEISVKSSNREVCCKYDYVWGPSSTQAEVYDQVKSSVSDVLKGFNSTIFAYGQTSSGKTHTMFGKESHIFDDPGIVPRCVRDIFKHSIGIDMSVFVSFIQVYNEQVYDMLDDPERRKPLSIHESSHSSISIAGLTEYQVHTFKQCMSLVELGLRNRTIRETHMNNASSRSHSILQITIEQKKFDISEDSYSLICSKLNLVDLAGSERWDSSGKGKGMANDQISELTNINSSLHTLGRCIAALARRPQTNTVSAMNNTSSKRYHIPFRDSKLTRILQDSIGGKSKTILVANINPSFRCADESISTLRFADRTHQVMTFAQVNQVVQCGESAEVKILRGEILRLRKLLEMNGIKHNDVINTDNSIIDEKSRQSQDKGAVDDLSPIAGNNPLHHEGDITKSNRKSISKLQQMICKKIIHALGSVLLSVDMFLKTINTIPTKPDDGQQQIMSYVSLFDKIHDLCEVDDDASANNKETKIEISSCVGSTVTTNRDYNNVSCNKNNITSNIMHNHSNSRKIKSSLSSLLKHRRELCSHIDENKVDVKLKEELNEAKRQRDQKLQLRQRLLEREEKAENPLLSFTLDN